MTLTLALSGLLTQVAAFPAVANTSTSEICDVVARQASSRTGVPLSVLMAIALTETGRKSGGAMRPWPWTVNMEGKGVWFDSAQEARDYAVRNFQRGARSFDVGCFQLNYKWHGKAFRSIEEMFDPSINASYAAKFLLDLFRETGSWEEAAGAYHSRTPEYANRYKKRFRAFRAKLEGRKDDRATSPMKLPGDDLVDDVARQPADRVNRFPLLLLAADQAPRLGSLVPLSAGTGGSRLIDVSGN